MSFKWHNVKKGFEIDIDNENRTPQEYEIPALTVGLEQEFIVRRKPFDECCEETDGLYRSIREIPERIPLSEVLQVLNPGYAKGEGSFTPEAWANIVEAKTEPGLEEAGVVRELRDLSRQLSRVIVGNGMQFVPFSLEPLMMAYGATDFGFIRRIVLRKHGPGATRIYGTASTQVNVAIEDGNAALFAYKAFTGIGAILLALTSNSPFHGGRSAGLFSIRANLRGTQLDGGWIAEDIPEKDWPTYLENRIKMCRFNEEIMAAPWAHNGPMRIRPDRKFCLEFAQPEFIPRYDAVLALTRFLRDLTRRVLIAYKEGEPLPAFLGSPLVMAQQKNMQAAAIEGKAANFICRDLSFVPLMAAVEELMVWAGGSYDALLRPTHAEEVIEQFRSLHPHDAEDMDGCNGCPQAISEVVSDAHQRFVAGLEVPIEGSLWDLDGILDGLAAERAV